ncbi:MAG: hypothetical protein ACI83B_000448 [Sediminicola sp.]|jgi:hypothetical protein|tara:strand:- start:625 stop:1059 length:435 start_codon:yes stop_codon:yes gene_type:complete
MNSKLIALFLGLILISCTNDDTRNDNNPNLLSPLISVNLNLNLPQFNPLKFPGNSLILDGEGIRGVVIYNVNNDLYTAFELSDPNHTPNGCSKMLINGILASCPCTTDTNIYDIVTGQHQSNEVLYPLQQYLVIRNGDNIQVTN